MSKFIKNLSVLFLCCLVLSTHSFAGRVQFFESIHDLPLMPGLIERSDDTLLFDKAGGRVIESYADILDVNDGEVVAYYSDSLPQFGWSKISEFKYQRGDEILEFAIEKNSGEKFFRVRISPL